MTSNKRKNYYAVAGVNGYGVYNDYTKVEASRPYIKNFRCKGCKTFEEAKELAISLYYEIRGMVAILEEMKNIKVMNWCYRTDL